MATNWPGASTEIMPPNAHVSLQLESSAGMLPINTVGTPGAHGPAGTGVQGIGVNTPSAAAVAAATAGFAKLEHMPNGITLRNGTLSAMLAAGAPANTRLTGNTTSEPGAIPMVHIVVAPALTIRPMTSPFSCGGS